MTRGKNPRATLALSAAALLLCGCVAAPEKRLELAESLGREAHMTRRTIAAGTFTLAAWERVGAKGQPATVYIEGDGKAWLSRHRPSPDPSPDDPLPLRLAAADPVANVVYLARPCQYGGTMNGGPCPMEYWTKKRLAPEVVEAYAAALGALAREHGFSGLHLVGYSGGAGIAALTAAGRSDVLSFRSVAGNLDNALFVKLHGISPMPDSLEPLEAAAKIARIPQRHFSGAKDRIVPGDIARAWRDASASPCVQLTTVPGATHISGWAEAWPALLRERVECGKE